MKSYDDIFRSIAESNNTTVEEVYREINIAIQSAKDNPDPEKRKEFAKIPCKGDIPTPEEFLDYMINRVGW